MIIADRDLLILPDAAALYASYRYSADVFAVIYRRNEELQLTFGVALGSGDMFKYHIEQRDKVLALYIRVEGRCAVSAGAVDNGTFELFVRGVEVEQEFEDFINDLFGSCIRAVCLVHHDDDLMSEFESLLQHETCLRHGSLEAVNEQENAVHHFEYALHLAGEIRVTGGIDNVDLDILILYRRVFCENGDTAFTFEVVAVHDALDHSLIFAVDAALFEHFIDQCGLAVIDVSYNCNIS